MFESNFTVLFQVHHNKINANLKFVKLDYLSLHSLFRADSPIIQPVKKKNKPDAFYALTTDSEH